MTYKELARKCYNGDYQCTWCTCSKLCDKFHKKYHMLPCDAYEIAKTVAELPEESNQLMVDLIIDIVEGRA